MKQSKVYLPERNRQTRHFQEKIRHIIFLKGLLHYPTCSTQLRQSTWSEVGRMHDLPQMTHFDVGESRRQPAVFVYLTFLIDEIGFFKLYDCIFCPIIQFRQLEILNKPKLRVVVPIPRHQNSSFVVGHAFGQLRTTLTAQVGSHKLGNVITPLQNKSRESKLQQLVLVRNDVM